MRKVFASLLTVLLATGPPAGASDVIDLAFLETFDEGDSYRVVVTDPAGDTRLLDDRPALGRPAVSPDGRYVVYTGWNSDGTDGFYNLFRVNRDGTGLLKLTDPTYGDFDPAYSPDGDTIAYSRDFQGSLNPSNCCRIYTMNADGTGETSVPNTTGGTHPSWSPDGTKLVFDRPAGLRITELDGTGQVSLATSGAKHPAWSPDGTLIAYVRPTSSGDQLKVIEPDGENAAIIFSTAQRLEDPQWIGASLYLVRHSGAGYDGRTDSQIIKVTLDGTTTVVFDDTEQIVHVVKTGAGPGCDYDGNGYSDLTIGIPKENIANDNNPGAIVVLPGSSGGVSTLAASTWNQGSPGIKGERRSGENFGTALACGDFDGDGFIDVAVGSPGSGEVNVIPGAAGGLTDLGDQLLPGVASQDSGSALAAGDFDGDGFTDLAIGRPSGEGAVSVWYGSASTLGEEEIWSQDSSGIKGVPENGDLFGTALVAGDFDGDGFDDLAVGVPGEGSSVPGHGGVNVIFGSQSGLTDLGDQIWSQATSGIAGVPEPGDRFGAALATGDVDGDGFDELAVGAPEEDEGSVADAGVVHLLFGTSTGLTDVGDEKWGQDSAGMPGLVEESDLFGAALAMGDANGDGYAELTVGIPDEDVAEDADAGAIVVLPGSAGGLTTSGVTSWNQGSNGVKGAREPGDRFGFSLSAADYDGDGWTDFAIGVRFDLGGGSVNVLYGSAGGLTDIGDELWNQDTEGVPGIDEEDDRFGSSVL